MADESRNESTENEETTPAEGHGETVSAPEGPVAPAAQHDAGEGDTAAEVEDAADVPVREPGPDEPVAEEAVAEEPEPPVAEAEPAPDVEAEAAAAEAPADEGGAAAPTAEAPQEPEPRRKRKRLPRMQRPRRRKPTRERPAERKPIARVAKPAHERGRRQERRGVVVSSAMDKTIVVRVDAVKAHPKYKKVVRRSTKFHAHDEQNQAKVGDIVRIVETRPLSKTKNWRLAEIVEVAK
jgi:small subunit ribosomal protein S17